MSSGAPRFSFRSTEQPVVARGSTPKQWMWRALMLGALLLPASAPAERDFPQTAKRGELTAHQYPYYTIDKKMLRLAVGGKIYNYGNMIIVPASLQVQTAQVMYSLDINGELAAIWLLTPAEAAKHPKPKQLEPK